MPLTPSNGAGSARVSGNLKCMITSIRELNTAITTNTERQPKRVISSPPRAGDSMGITTITMTRVEIIFADSWGP